MSNYCDHIRAIFNPYKDHVLAIFTIFMLPDALKAQNFTEESCTANRVQVMYNYGEDIWAIFGPY